MVFPETAYHSIIYSAIANAMTGLFAYLGRKSGEWLTGKDLSEKLKLSKNTLQSILEEALRSFSDNVEIKPPGSMEEVSIFLSSPEVEAFARQIFSRNLLDSSDKKHLKSIREEFLTSYSLFMGMDKEILSPSADYFMDTLFEGVEVALNQAIDRGILSAHESKASFRHTVIIDQLSVIEKNLNFLLNQTQPSVKSIIEFEKKYRRQVEFRHRDIIPPNFDQIQRKPIDELYVCPNFRLIPRNPEEKKEIFSYTDFISTSYRAALLGTPGAGKSTFAYKLSHDLSSKYSEKLFGGRLVTPILIILRDYGTEKLERKCSILQYIESRANSFYQVEPPEKAFEYLLLNGRVVVIFDGLDELMETNYRQEISGDIEAFCNLYPSVPVIVTSREVGYEQAPLDTKIFETYRLESFTDNQIKEYSKKWFKLDETLTEKQLIGKVESFMLESKSASDLCTNPLLLALICNLYRRQNYIPRSRPEVYENCAEMLFKRWDEWRGIRVLHTIEAHLRPILMFLAHWLFLDKSLQDGVTEKRIVAKTTKYLYEKRFENWSEAEQAAKEFVKFCKGRAWVFTDIGTTKNGEKLFQFTHRTFLEYFTATYLIRTHPTPNRLKRVLLPKIARQEWDIVSQLAFQIIDRNIEGAGDELMEGVIQEVYKSTGKRMWNNLFFITRALEFIVPSPRVLRKIISETINACLQFGLASLSNSSNTPVYDNSFPPQVFGSLLGASIENQSNISKIIKNVLHDMICSGCDDEAMLLIEMVAGLDIALLGYDTGKFAGSNTLKFWKIFGDGILVKCYERILCLSKKYLPVCIVAHNKKLIYIDSFIECYGFFKLFTRIPCVFYKGVFLYGPVDNIMFDLYKYLFTEQGNTVNQSIVDLKILGKKILDIQPIFTSFIDEMQSVSLKALEIIKKTTQYLSLSTSQQDFDKDCLLALIFIAIVYQEGSRKIYSVGFLDAASGNKNSLLYLTKIIFTARYCGGNKNRVKKKIAQWGFSKKQERFIWRWISKVL